MPDTRRPWGVHEVDRGLPGAGTESVASSSTKRGGHALAVAGAATARRRPPHRQRDVGASRPGPRLHRHLRQTAATGSPCRPGRSILRYDATMEFRRPTTRSTVGVGPGRHRGSPGRGVRLPAAQPVLLARRAPGRAWDTLRLGGPGMAAGPGRVRLGPRHIPYEVGASTATTTAYDVWESRTGVCRDLTQLGMTLCRALNVPARYVAGYLPDIGVNPAGPPHGLLLLVRGVARRAVVDLRPPQQRAADRAGRHRRGRDALDAAMVTTWGAAELKVMTVWAERPAMLAEPTTETGGRRLPPRAEVPVQLWHADPPTPPPPGGRAAAPCMVASSAGPRADRSGSTGRVSVKADAFGQPRRGGACARGSRVDRVRVVGLGEPAVGGRR